MGKPRMKAFFETGEAAKLLQEFHQLKRDTVPEMSAADRLQLPTTSIGVYLDAIGTDIFESAVPSGTGTVNIKFSPGSITFVEPDLADLALTPEIETVRNFLDYIPR